LILEERPQGKGHAVRTGFQHATGDFILIQDADLEYDLEDYEALLEPLLTGHEAFVLGSRHGGRTWKIRHFEGNPISTLLFNVGHWFFCSLLNILYGLRLNDPFTMYKVFRQDCLYGLTFECNRFDFDYELLIKLVRKGYNPVEIPVNYNARSFEAGKKVSVTRDPWTWLRALIKYRLVSIDPIRLINKKS
jgi:glycosyltransferase involved in cell wall biosynthesis